MLPSNLISKPLWEIMRDFDEVLTYKFSTNSQFHKQCPTIQFYNYTPPQHNSRTNAHGEIIQKKKEI